MSEKQRQELESNGFLVVKNWHAFLTIIILVAGIVVSWAEMRTTIAQDGARIARLENWSDKHEAEQIVSVAYRNTKLDEISYNLQMMCLKMNVKYITNDNNQRSTK